MSPDQAAATSALISMQATPTPIVPDVSSIPEPQPPSVIVPVSPFYWNFEGTLVFEALLIRRGCECSTRSAFKFIFVWWGEWIGDRFDHIAQRV